VLLESSRNYLINDPPEKFRYLQVSTDEVYGTSRDDRVIRDSYSYLPDHPLSASRAAAEMLCSSWHRSSGFPAIITHGTTNYGKRLTSGFLSFVVESLIGSEQVKIYDGKQVRDWLHVTDHCRGLILAAKYGKPGKVYNFGSNESWSNFQIVNMICDILDEIFPRRHGHKSLVQYIDDGFEGRGVKFDIKKTYDDLIWIPNYRFMPTLRQMVGLSVQRNFEAAGIKVAS
jgi:dTDP-glucose 4,6-dehydratase